jgi:hypothetical protein
MLFINKKRIYVHKTCERGAIKVTTFSIVGFNITLLQLDFHKNIALTLCNVII